MQKFIWDTLSKDKRNKALARPAGLSDPAIAETVREIFAQVKDSGDKAVLALTRRFDTPKLARLSVPMQDCKAAWDALPADQQAALKTAKANIERFHSAQSPVPITVQTQDGVNCQRLPRRLDSAGLYVPGGTAPLVSTLMMLAIPAKLAGVPRRVVTTPPGRGGTVNPAILAAAHLCGVTDVFACGGAQAIAALTFGTKSIPACVKIFGPGNAYVAAAKTLAAQLSGGPAIDLPAGPSEAMVVADSAADPAFTASDLLSQAEHDKLAQVICIAETEQVAANIEAEISRQLASLPRREIAREALATSRLIVSGSRADWLDIINAYAPEHLILQCEDAEALVPDIINAGSVFIGPWTPESVGDYASGTNHTLPTGGAAKSYSGITLDSFYKFMSVQSLTAQGLAQLGPAVMTLANMEGLEAHRRAVEIRLAVLDKSA